MDGMGDWYQVAQKNSGNLGALHPAPATSLEVTVGVSNSFRESAQSPLGWNLGKQACLTPGGACSRLALPWLKVHIPAGEGSVLRCRGLDPNCLLLVSVRKQGSIGINPKFSSSHAPPQGLPWVRGTVLVSVLWVPSQVCRWLWCDPGHIYKDPSRGTAPNMIFSSWEHLQWQFC